MRTTLELFEKEMRDVGSTDGQARAARHAAVGNSVALCAVADDGRGSQPRGPDRREDRVVIRQGDAELFDVPGIPSHDRKSLAWTAELVGRSDERGYAIAAIEGLVDYRAANAAGSAEHEQARRRAGRCFECGVFVGIAGHHGFASIKIVTAATTAHMIHAARPTLATTAALVVSIPFRTIRPVAPTEKGRPFGSNDVVKHECKPLGGTVWPDNTSANFFASDLLKIL